MDNNHSFDTLHFGKVDYFTSIIFILYIIELLSFIDGGIIVNLSPFVDQAIIDTRSGSTQPLYHTAHLINNVEKLNENNYLPSTITTISLYNKIN